MVQDLERVVTKMRWAKGHQHRILFPYLMVKTWQTQ